MTPTAVRLTPSLGLTSVAALVIGLLVGSLTALTPDPDLAEAAAAIVTLALAGIPLIAIDLREKRLPDAITYPLATGLLGLHTAAGVTAGHPHDALMPALGAATLAGLYLAIALAGGGGGGDVKLALGLGAALAGTAGWMGLATATLLAFLAALPHALANHVRKGTDLPFGPYMLVGTLAVQLAHLIAR